MIWFFKLIKWHYILGLILALYLVKYTLFLPAESHKGLVSTLNSFQFLILNLALVCIAASGYVIRALYSMDSDRINLPKHRIIGKQVSETFGFNCFILLSIIGVGLGFYVCHLASAPKLVTLFFILSALQYVHATALQQVPLLGNILAALVFVLPLLVVSVIELVPPMTMQNKNTQFFFIYLTIDYAVFMALLRLVFELLNDNINYKGNHQMGIQTIAVTLGKRKATTVTAVFCLFPIVAMVYYLLSYVFSQTIILLLVLIFIVAPLIYVCINLFNNSENNKKQKNLLTILDIITALSVIMLLLFYFIITS